MFFSPIQKLPLLVSDEKINTKAKLGIDTVSVLVIETEGGMFLLF